MTFGEFFTGYVCGCAMCSWCWRSDRVPQITWTIFALAAIVLEAVYGPK